MTKKEFKRLLFNGRGKAIQYLKSCSDPMKYADIIAYCCTHDTSYDAQCEGSGAIYLCDVITLTGYPDHFKKIIMDKLEKRLPDDWAVHRMLEILMNLYFEGHEDVFPFLDKLYRQEFERLAGKKGSLPMKFSAFESLCITIAEINESYYPRTVHLVGRYLTEHPDSEAFSLDWFCSHCSEHKKLLKRVPPEYVKAFRDAFEWTPHRDIPAEKRLIPTDINELKRRIFSDEVTPMEKDMACRWFGRVAYSEDIEEIMALIKKSFFEEHNEELTESLLCTFENSKLPPDPDLMEEIFHGCGDSLGSKCLEIMGRHGLENAEKYALEILEKSESEDLLQSDAFCAYVESAKNYDDIMKLLDDFPKEQFVYAVHGAFLCLKNRKDKHSRRAKRLLMYFYENNPCSCCRLTCVQYMSKCRCLTDEILNECLYDHNTDMREYARKLLKRRGALEQ